MYHGFMLRSAQMTKLRGVQDEPTVTLRGTNWSETLADLASQLEGALGTAWGRGAQVWLEADDYSPNSSELEQLVWLLEMHDLKLAWWKDVDVSGERKWELAEKLHSSPAATDPETQPLGSPEKQEQQLRNAALVSQTLRSGQLVRYAGSVVVFGDVNPGAAIIADGSVFVWGRLRGVVHAGAAGDDGAVVGALQLAPTQLRIGVLIARAPDANKDAVLGAEIARVRDGRITIEDWDDGKF